MRKRKEREEPLSHDEVLDKLQHYCAYQDRCLYEIEQKFQKLEACEEICEKVLASLKKDRFWDEQRFAIIYVRSKWELKNWGKIKIRNHLRAKRVPENYWIAAFDQIEDEDYQGTMQELADKKWTNLSRERDVFKRKKKLHDFLMGRGFEKGLVMGLLSRIKITDED